MTLCGGWGSRGEFTVAERSGALEEPVEGGTEFAVAQRTPFGEVTLGVVDRARERVQVIVESVDFVATNHDLVRAECQIGGTLTRHPVPLPTTLTAELAGPSRT
jgi:hypothetical protein